MNIGSVETLASQTDLRFFKLCSLATLESGLHSCCRICNRENHGTAASQGGDDFCHCGCMAIGKPWARCYPHDVFGRMSPGASSVFASDQVHVAGAAGDGIRTPADNNAVACEPGKEAMRATFRNEGATCYLNALLQALFHCDEFASVAAAHDVDKCSQELVTRAASRDAGETADVQTMAPCGVCLCHSLEKQSRSPKTMATTLIAQPFIRYNSQQDPTEVFMWVLESSFSAPLRNVLAVMNRVATNFRIDFEDNRHLVFFTSDRVGNECV